MQEEEKHTLRDTPPASTEPAQKRQKPKSFLETMREIDAQEARREQEAEEKRQAILAQREKKEKEAYAKQIQQDRIELMRLKQGIIEESETIREEKEEKSKLSIWKKIQNFFYHSKWWLWITVFIVGVFGYLLFDFITKVRPDMIVMVLSDDPELQLRTQELEAYFEQFTDDENGDGKIQVDIYPIPVNDNIGVNDYYTGDATKLSTQMMLADCVMVVTDAKANEYILADQTLENLEELYPDNAHTWHYGYYLSDTDFATKIDYPGNVDFDLSIGLRTPIETYDSLEDMEETYAVAQKVLERVMADLDNTTPPADTPETEAETTSALETEES